MKQWLLNPPQEIVRIIWYIVRSDYCSNLWSGRLLPTLPSYRMLSAPWACEGNGVRSDHASGLEPCPVASCHTQRESQVHKASWYFSDFMSLPQAWCTVEHPCFCIAPVVHVSGAPQLRSAHLVQGVHWPCRPCLTPLQPRQSPRCSSHTSGMFPVQALSTDCPSASSGLLPGICMPRLAHSPSSAPFSTLNPV